MRVKITFYPDTHYRIRITRQKGTLKEDSGEKNALLSAIGNLYDLIDPSDAASHPTRAAMDSGVTSAWLSEAIRRKLERVRGNYGYNLSGIVRNVSLNTQESQRGQA